jgi:hypothetical protein
MGEKHNHLSEKVKCGHRLLMDDRESEEISQRKRMVHHKHTGRLLAVYYWYWYCTHGW